MKLLSKTNPFAEDPDLMPDSYYEFVSQFIYNQGSWESKIDVESLMILLWRMHSRIQDLEAGL